MAAEDMSVDGQENPLLTRPEEKEIIVMELREASEGQIQEGADEELKVEVNPLQLQLAVVPLGTKLNIRVSRTDTVGKLHQMICEKLKLEKENARIWDCFKRPLDDPATTLQDIDIILSQDIVVEIKISGRWPDDVNSVGSRSIENGPHASKAGTANGYVRQYPLYSIHKHKKSDWWLLGRSSTAARLGQKGLTGLQNLGNTCFMNSALQCLVHTPPLASYVLHDYSSEINRHNPLGMKGEFAIAFGELLRNLWATEKQAVAPRTFKAKLDRLAPQFRGYNQHDSHELLALLLDGLHEDLNRVKNKLYVEAKEANGRPDREVATEYWENHQSRNDSVIVDHCQGQYKSTLACSVCSKVSVTFDPFMYLSITLPQAPLRPNLTTRSMTVTVFSGDGRSPPTLCTGSRQGRHRDLIQAIGVACNLGRDEQLLLVELYNHRIFLVLEEPLDWLTAIRDNDRLAAYRLPKSEKGPLLVLLNRRLEFETDNAKNSSQTWKLFAAPIITCLPEDAPTGAELLMIVRKLLSPMERPEFPAPTESMEMEGEPGYTVVPLGDIAMEGRESDSVDGHSGPNGNVKQLETDSSNSRRQQPETPFRLWITDEKGTTRKGSVLMDKPIPPASSSARAYSKMTLVAVDWASSALEQEYDMSKVDMPPEVLETALPTTSKTAPQEAVTSLYTCLESFLKEEPLGSENTWYCPDCKEHREASKKLDLWRLPEILIVHLKRFCYHQRLKLDTFVNFPIHDLDLSTYVASSSEPQGYVYELYAISNHHGSMDGGHYTAHAKLIDEDKWCNFNDSHVSSVNECELKTTAAYVLFYKRIRREESFSTIDEQQNGVKGHVSNHRDLSLSSTIVGSESLNVGETQNLSGMKLKTA